MRMLCIARYILVLFGLTFLTSAFSDSSGHGSENAVNKMAEIVLHLNHYPSDQEKEVLENIADDGNVSENERIMAMALANLQHKVSASDRDRLEAIINDESAPSDVRELAMIIHGVNHMPSAADKEKLRQILQ